MIGKKLKNLRSRDGITQEELAKILNLTTGAVAQYETDIRNPSFEVLFNIAKHFSVTTDYILGLVDKETESIQYPDDPYTVIVVQAKKKKISPTRLLKLINFLESESESLNPESSALDEFAE